MVLIFAFWGLGSKMTKCQRVCLEPEAQTEMFLILWCSHTLSVLTLTPF